MLLYLDNTFAGLLVEFKYIRSGNVSKMAFRILKPY
jgi:hypothetical protein